MNTFVEHFIIDHVHNEFHNRFQLWDKLQSILPRQRKLGLFVDIPITFKFKHPSMVIFDNVSLLNTLNFAQFWSVLGILLVWKILNNFRAISFIILVHQNFLEFSRLAILPEQTIIVISALRWNCIWLWSRVYWFMISKFGTTKKL